MNDAQNRNASPDLIRGSFRLPDTSKRTLVVGRTGTGKTVFMLWLLSKMPFDQMPFVIIDYKLEPHFRGIDRRAIQRLDAGDKIPKLPGLYMIQPGRTAADHEALAETFGHIWRQRRVGIFCDEADELRETPELVSILTQGRTLHIPCILGTQRPVGLTTYAFTQADFFAAFPLGRRIEDVRRMKAYLGDDQFQEVRDYHSLWHDVSRDQSLVLKPVPGPDILLDRINAKAPHRLWW